MAGLAPHSSGGYGGGVGGGQDDYGFMSVAAAPSGNMNPQGGMFSQADLRAPETDEDYENEPPLLEELGIDFEHIMNKIVLALNPLKPVEETVLNDTDLAGPLVFCVVLGFCSLLAGKLHFGYIYGFGAIGCIAMYTVLNLMCSHTPIDMPRVFSVLGYSILPIVALSAVNVFLDLRGQIGAVLAAVAILMATYTATRTFAKACHMQDQRYLIAYPVFLLYSCFALITVF